MITNPPIGASGHVPAPDPHRPRGAASPAPSARTESLSADNAIALRDAIAQTPAERADVVEHARSIVVDPSYPPLQIIERVAKLIAASQDPSETAE